MSKMQYAVALFLMATSSCVITDAARGVLKNKSETSSVDLRSAYNFTVLAYSTVTNTGATTVGGLLGVSPGSAVAGETSISFSELPTLHGRASTEEAATAKADITTAYLDAAGRTQDVQVISVVNIGGSTFTPGLYKTTGGLEVSSGTLYLNGAGVYIFQIATTLQMSTGLKMVLQNGALASNVFWQVGSSAIFEVGSEVVGNVMAYAAITAKTGCKVTGRLFAMNAAVVMDSNVMVFPM